MRSGEIDHIMHKFNVCSYNVVVAVVVDGFIVGNFCFLAPLCSYG